MPVSCDPNDLSREASCLQKCIPIGSSEAIKIWLLTQIAGVSSDPQFLIDQSRCIQNCIPTQTLKAIEVWLLCQVVNNGGGGGENNFPLEWTPQEEDIGPWFGLEIFDSDPSLTGITSLTFKMETLVEAIDIENADDLEAVSFPNLVTANGPIAFIGNASLASISFPLMTSFGTSTFKDNPSLITLSVPLWVPTNGANYEFDGNAFDAATVNQILARAVANAGFVTGTINVSGGTSETPTGQGLTDVATLQGRGVTVLANGLSASATDTFNRADSDPISNPMSDGVATWTSGPGALEDIEIVGNECTGAAGGYCGGRVASPIFAADQRATIEIGAQGDATQIVGPMVRMQGSADASGYLLLVDNSTTLIMYRVVDTGGLGFTQLGASYAVPALNAGDTIGIGIVGTTLTAYLNGVQTGATRTDATYASGQPGLLSLASEYIAEFTASDE